MIPTNSEKIRQVPRSGLVSLYWLRIAAGPLLALLTWRLFPASGGSNAAITAAVAVWMGIWWLTEALPLSITSLLPLVLFPLSGVIKAKVVASQYTNDVVFLFIGGFLVALAMEKWNLHRRIALHILLSIGGGVKRTLLGFMAATAFLSMWISNTATAMMMVPIAAAVISKYSMTIGAKRSARFATGLMLGIAYAASIGGMATLVGTPPNLVFISIYRMDFPAAREITFASWFFFAVPLTILLFFITWMILSSLYMRKLGASFDHATFRTELESLGKIGFEEKVVLTVFAALALLWISRKPISLGFLTLPGWSMLLPEPSFAGDGTVAITMAILLFLIPSRRDGEPILTASIFRKLPWGIVLLFGGGFALARAFGDSGLSLWIGHHVERFAEFPTLGVTAGICTVMTFLTELTSNTATTQMALPILGAAATAMGIAPYLMMVPATLSASCAFMMPVATPPNAIVFGTGHVRVYQMAKTGILLNLVGIVLITFWVLLFSAAAFG